MISFLLVCVFSFDVFNGKDNHLRFSEDVIPCIRTGDAQAPTTGPRCDGGVGCKMASPFIRRGSRPRPRDSRREGPYLVPKPEAQLARWRQMISKPQNRTLAMQPTDRPSGVVRFPLLGSRPTTWLAFMATVASQSRAEHRVDRRSWERRTEIWKRGGYFDSAGKKI